jgi:hypothetical protein
MAIMNGTNFCGQFRSSAKTSPQHSREGIRSDTRNVVRPIYGAAHGPVNVIIWMLSHRIEAALAISSDILEPRIIDFPSAHA